jgi:exosortase/archaeosortase family protein
MLAALAVATYAFVFGSPLRWYVRVLVLVTVPLPAVGCNVLRLLLLIWVQKHGGTEVAAEIQTLSGWLVLIVGLVALFVITRSLERVGMVITVSAPARDEREPEGADGTGR